MIIVGDIGNTETKICLVNSKNIIIKRVTLITKKINYPLLRKSLAILSLKNKVIDKKLKEGIKIKLVYLEVEANTADVLGNEPVYHNNERVGLTTSGAYGFRVNKSLAFAYVNSNLVKVGTEFLIDIQGQKIKSKIIEEPAFDPKNLRLKS